MYRRSICISFEIDASENQFEIISQVKAKIRNASGRYDCINTGSSGMGSYIFKMHFSISKYDLKPFLHSLGSVVQVRIIEVERQRRDMTFSVLDCLCHNMCLETRRKYVSPVFGFSKTTKKYEIKLNITMKGDTRTGGSMSKYVRNPDYNGIY